jgi:hypothetical protein
MSGKGGSSNDLGVLTAKIIQKLGEDGEIDVIDGFIYVPPSAPFLRFSLGVLHSR